jgi:hypothetical protein
MSPRISGFSSPTVSPTVASISTDKAIDFPRRANAGPALSGEAGVSFRRGLRGEDIDTVGMTVADATIALNAAGFPTVSAPQPSQNLYFVHDATVPAGNVVGTDPPAGKAVISSSAILLIISKGP